MINFLSYFQKTKGTAQIKHQKTKGTTPKRQPPPPRWPAAGVAVNDKDWVIKHVDILRYEAESTTSTEFLMKIYSDEGYIAAYGSRKMGNRAINWKDSGSSWFCDCLHAANNTCRRFHFQEAKRKDALK